MANGPDRSNGLNLPSGWAKRSAIAHKAAEFTPSPIWLANKYLDILGDNCGGAAGRLQFTMPSVREVSRRQGPAYCPRWPAGVRRCHPPFRRTLPDRGALHWSPARRLQTGFPASRRTSPDPCLAVQVTADAAGNSADDRDLAAGSSMDAGEPVARAPRIRATPPVFAAHLPCVGVVSEVGPGISAAAPSTGRWRETPGNASTW